MLTKNIEIIYNDGHDEKTENATDEDVRRITKLQYAKNSNISTVRTTFDIVPEA